MKLNVSIRRAYLKEEKQGSFRNRKVKKVERCWNWRHQTYKGIDIVLTGSLCRGIYSRRVQMRVVRVRKWFRRGDVWIGRRLLRMIVMVVIRRVVKIKIWKRRRKGTDF